MPFLQPNQQCQSTEGTIYYMEPKINKKVNKDEDSKNRYAQKKL